MWVVKNCLLFCCLSVRFLCFKNNSKIKVSQQKKNKLAGRLVLDPLLPSAQAASSGPWWSFPGKARKPRLIRRFSSQQNLESVSASTIWHWRKWAFMRNQEANLPTSTTSALPSSLTATATSALSTFSLMMGQSKHLLTSLLSNSMQPNTESKSCTTTATKGAFMTMPSDKHAMMQGSNSPVVG